MVLMRISSKPAVSQPHTPFKEPEGLWHLESQVAHSGGPLYPKVARQSLKVGHNYRDLSHGPLVWTPNLEALHTRYIPFQNKGPNFKPHPNKGEKAKGPNQGPYVQPKWPNMASYSPMWPYMALYPP